jgi:putative copper resistance protein D
MLVFYFISVFFHIVSAMIWVGGLVFFVLVMVPLVRQEEYKGIAPGIVHWVGLRFRFWGWVCLSALVISGLFNLFVRGFGWADLLDGALWHGYFGETLAIKLIFAGIIFFLSAIHDFYIGPKATNLWQQDLQQESFRFRRAASWIGRINLLLSLCVVFLAIMLVRGKPW